MVKAHELAQTLRARSEARRVKADARAARLHSRLPQATKLLIEQYHARRVVLFGSLATRTYSEYSDVDLAVEGMPSASYFHALADLMALAIDSVRPAVLSGKACVHLQRLLSFRHSFRHAYAIDWDGSRLDDLRVCALAAVSPVSDNLARFDRFLAEVGIG